MSERKGDLQRFYASQNNKSGVKNSNEFHRDIDDLMHFSYAIQIKLKLPTFFRSNTILMCLTDTNQVRVYSKLDIPLQFVLT